VKDDSTFGLGDDRTWPEMPIAATYPLELAPGKSQKEALAG